MQERELQAANQLMAMAMVRHPGLTLFITIMQDGIQVTGLYDMKMLERLISWTDIEQGRDDSVLLTVLAVMDGVLNDTGHAARN